MNYSDHTKLTSASSVPSLSENDLFGSSAAAPISLMSRHHDAPPDFLTPTWVVYSHPTWSSARKDLGVFLSLFPRDPDSWRGPWVIYEGPSAYSDLAHLELSPSPGAPPAVAFACLFECGTKTAYDEICFSIFTLYELIDNLPRDAQLGNNSIGNERKLAGGKCRHEAQSAPAVQQATHVKKRRKKSKLRERCSLS